MSVHALMLSSNDLFCSLAVHTFSRNDVVEAGGQHIMEHLVDRRWLPKGLI